MNTSVKCYVMFRLEYDESLGLVVATQGPAFLSENNPAHHTTRELWIDTKIVGSGESFDEAELDARERFRVLHPGIPCPKVIRVEQEPARFEIYWRGDARALLFDGGAAPLVNDTVWIKERHRSGVRNYTGRSLKLTITDLIETVAGLMGTVQIEERFPKT